MQVCTMLGFPPNILEKKGLGRSLPNTSSLRIPSSKRCQNGPVLGVVCDLEISNVVHPISLNHSKNMIYVFCVCVCVCVCVCKTERRDNSHKHDTVSHKFIAIGWAACRLTDLVPCDRLGRTVPEIPAGQVLPGDRAV